MHDAHTAHISSARRRVAMVACAAPRGQEETVEGLTHSRAQWKLLARREKPLEGSRARRISELGTLDQPTSTRAE
ncbi:hypothetical protein NDU88_002960 [Pleurodeles waltl]|uniref:Uncharacterized protein n=1 Tax=Pleurodeles waltl TaxID=8319 RepID=A0AAV7VEE9_PLEWA|nr:hypothetical protein NDU88_002960 [Pleurodeles waltl]